MVFRSFPSTPLKRIGVSPSFYLPPKWFGYALAFCLAPLFLDHPAFSYGQDVSQKAKSNLVTPIPVPRPPIAPLDTNPPAPAKSAILTGPALAVPLNPSSSEPSSIQPSTKEGKKESTAPVKIEERYGLPPASRQRLHECTIEWQKMKLAGATNDKIWRDFAQICLVK
jgi:hypothetical protein